MSSKTILITGATDGIGRATALSLARRGAQVVVHGRNPDKVAEVCAAVRAAAPDEAAPQGLVADISTLDGVRELAQAVRRSQHKLDVLINNAGVFMKERQITDDGFEVTFAVNHLATFLLTELLLPLLRASAPARVLTVSSVAHTRGQIHWDDLNLERNWDSSDGGPPLPGYPAYAQSKLANVLFSNALARRVEGDEITSNSLHPGTISTKLLHEGFGMGGASTDTGAETSVYLALSPEVEGLTGRYFSNSQEVEAAPLARDEAAQERLWTVSAEMTGVADRSDGA